jgi:putative phosphoribosyl transferase
MIKLAAGDTPGLFALVSRAGRLDLAGAAPLRRNRIPLLAIAGGYNDATRAPATQAYALIDGPKAWHEIENASERFIEPGALDAASTASLQWLERWRPATIDLSGTG